MQWAVCNLKKEKDYIYTPCKTLLSLTTILNRYLGCDSIGTLTTTREAISPEETFKCEPSPSQPGLFTLRSMRSTYLSIDTATTPPAIRGDADSISPSTEVRLRMQARFKPKNKDEDLERVGLRLYSQICCTNFCPLWATYKEGDEDRSIHENETKNGRPAVPENIRDGASHEYTDKCTALTGLEEGRLPFCLDGVNRRHDAGVGYEDAVSLLEVLECDEVAVQEHVERFHDATDTSAEPECSRDSPLL